MKHLLHFYALPRRSMMALCVVAATTVSRANAETVPAETAVRREVAGMGLSVGYNGAVNGLVAVHVEEKAMQPPEKNPDFLAVRNRMLANAELNARCRIVRALDLHWTGMDVSALMLDDDAGAAGAGSAASIASRIGLYGCTAIAIAESYSGGTYAVAVAERWSPGFHEDVVRSLRGGDGAAANGKEAWRKWAKGRDMLSLPAAVKFTGEDGVVRFAGISAVDVESLETGSPRMRAAFAKARENARLNLSLMLYADVQSRELAAREFAYGDDAGDFAAEFMQKIESEHSRGSDNTTASAPEVYGGFAVHPLTGRRVWVCVCGYEPDVLAKLVAPSSPRAATRRRSASASGAKPRRQRWNPITGKFEQVDFQDTRERMQK